MILVIDFFHFASLIFQFLDFIALILHVADLILQHDTLMHGNRDLGVELSNLLDILILHLVM